MLRSTLTIFLSLLCFFCFSQNGTFQKKYKDSADFTAVKTKNDYSLDLNGVPIKDVSKKSKDQNEVEDFYFSAVKTELLSLYNTEQVKIIDWSQKFAHKATETFFNPKKENEIIDSLTISKRYSVNEIWTNDKEYVYFFSDGDPDGNEPTNIIYKSKGKYVFTTDDIKASDDTATIINNFSFIVSFIQKNKEINLPKISVVQTGDAYQLRFENGGNVPITAGQATQLKGKEVSKNGDEIVSELKAASKETTAENNKTDNPAETTKPATEQEKSTAKYDLQIAGRTYNMELWNKDSNYYVNICGTAVDTVTIKAEKTQKEIKQDSCLKSTDKISGFDNNEDNFKLMVNNVVKKLNKYVDVDTTEKYKKQLDLAYVYFKGEVAKKEATDKSEKFVADIIKQSHLDEIAKEEVTITKVGTIILKDSMINIYSDGKKESVAARVKIDSVRFSIEEGKLSRRLLYVETEKGTFINKKAPIPVLRINDRSDDKLLNLDKNVDTYLKLGELLKYIPDGGYVPDDAENLVLNRSKIRKDLSAASNLNSLVNFSIYTDLVGLLGRRANGLLITDVTGKFITNSGNYKNWDLTPFSFIEGNVTLSKFDSKFKSIDSTDIKIGQGGAKDTVDRMKLMQTAWLKGSIKFNLFSLRLFSSQYFRMNLGARINVVNGDSLFNVDRDILFFDYFPEFEYSINRIKNFGMDLSLKWIKQRVADREPFANNEWQEVFNPQIAFFYYPAANPANKIYLRFNYYANRKKDANNFYQLQFGWKTGLKLSK